MGYLNLGQFRTQDVSSGAGSERPLIQINVRLRQDPQAQHLRQPKGIMPIVRMLKPDVPLDC